MGAPIGYCRNISIARIDKRSKRVNASYQPLGWLADNAARMKDERTTHEVSGFLLVCNSGIDQSERMTYYET